MGGSAGRGNFTPSAEFNIGIDPEAASRVFTSGLEIFMCGLDVTHQALLTPEYLAILPQLGRSGKMLHSIFSHYRGGSMKTGLFMHDLCAIAAVVHPNIFTWHSCFVAIETQGNWTSGNTVVDIEGLLGQKSNVQVALKVDINSFRTWVAEVLALAP
jgi:non-specific riboncleoside hydrolase